MGQVTDRQALFKAFSSFSTTLDDHIDLSTVFDEFRDHAIPVVETIRKRNKVKEAIAERKKKQNITIDGVSYPSASIAAKALGIDSSLIRYRCISRHFPTWINDAFPKRTQGTQTDQRGKRALKVIIHGVEYNSLTAAAEKLSMSIGAVNHRIHSDLFPDWYVK